jgi:hypothetical protein
MSFQDLKQSEVMVIDWVNSLDIPSCTLVDDLNDLKSGCVVSDIVSWLKDQPLRGIQRNIQSIPQAVHNWTIILSEIADMAPATILCNAEEILQVIFI